MSRVWQVPFARSNDASCDEGDVRFPVMMRRLNSRCTSAFERAFTTFVPCTPCFCRPHLSIG